MIGASDAVAEIRKIGHPNVSIHRSVWTLPALGLALLALQAAAVAAQLDDASRVDIALILTQGLVYIGAVQLLLRGAPVRLGWVLGIALILRATVLFLPPYLSSDVYRYVWDGRVQGSGVNPYVYIPNDAALSGLRDASVWPNINRADYAPTIYPPAAQVLFYLITRAGAGVTGMKVAWLLFESVTALATVRLLDLMNLPRGQLLVYAWCPLVVWEIAGSGHLDAAMAAFVTLAIFASVRKRDGFAGVALGCAVLIKFLPVVILPALWRRRSWRLPAFFVATVILLYLPYLGAGAKVFGFLPSYTREEGLRDGTGFWIPRLVDRVAGLTVSPLLYVAAAAILMGCLSLFVLRSREDLAPVKGALALAAVGMFALSTGHPWYFVWLMPLICLAPRLPLLWLAACSPILYWPNPYAAPWNYDVLYGGVCILALGRPFLSLLRRFTSNGITDDNTDTHRAARP